MTLQQQPAAATAASAAVPAPSPAPRGRPRPPPPPTAEAMEAASSPVPGMRGWRFVGPPLEAGPLPAVVYFGLGASETLGGAPFDAFPRALVPYPVDSDTSSGGSGGGGDGVRGGETSGGAAAADHGRATAEAGGGNGSSIVGGGGNDGGAGLVAAGGVRVFSVTLPAHGTASQNITALDNWAAAYGRGTPVVGRFVSRVAAGIAALTDGGVIAPGRLVAAGVSRGGLVASLLGAASPAVAAVVAFAPVTWLGDLPAFRGDAAATAAGGSPAPPPSPVAVATAAGAAAAGVTTTATAAPSAASSAAVAADAVAGNAAAIAALATKPVRFYTGNRDVLVRTRGAFEVVEALADAAHAAGVRSPPAELVCYCSIGKDGHGTPVDILLDGAAWVRSTLRLGSRPGGGGAPTVRGCWGRKEGRERGGEGGGNTEDGGGR